MAVQTIRADSVYTSDSNLWEGLSKGGLFNRKLVRWKVDAGKDRPRFSVGVSALGSKDPNAKRLLRAKLVFGRILPHARPTLAFEGLCEHPTNGPKIFFSFGDLPDPTSLMKTVIPL